MELLAPAGTLEGFQAVLAQKPDVIYLGAGELNARPSEAQFALEALEDLVAQARRQGVKIYFTLNVLIKDSEFARALKIAAVAHRAGATALIVQDKGLMLALKEHFPEMVIHASTQCSVGSREQLAELLSLNVSRVVLARELSLEQISDLTGYAHSLGLEVEVFTHGATCMSVSGQCHLSYCIGGRSANRGECAQPCRRRYQLLQNEKEERDFAPFLSPRDLSYFPYLKELAEAKVDALKIEGRLRSPEYQAQVTAICRTAMQEVEKGLPDAEIFTRERQRNLTIAFNRGGSFQAAFLKNQRDASFLSGDSVGHQGYYLGRVTQVLHRQGILCYAAQETDYLPAAGSQISLKNSRGSTVATAPVGVVRRSAGKSEVTLKGFHPRVLERLHLPLTVWQQKQKRVPEQDQRALAKVAKEPLCLTLYREGETYVLELKTAHRQLSFSSSELTPPPEPAGSPLPLDRIEQQLSKLGNTPYELVRFTSQLAEGEGPAWHIADLNAFRRAAVAKLLAAADSSSADSGHSRAGNIVPDEVTAAYSGPEPAISGPLAHPQVSTSLDRPPFHPSAVRCIINLPNYQAGMDLSGFAGQKGELLVLPLEELSLALEHDPALRKLRQSLGQASLGAYLAPLRAWSCPLSPEETLQRLAANGLSALLSSTSGTAELVRAAGLDLELFLWQGGQISNARSFEFFAGRGYHGLMISPELSEREQEALAARFADSPTRPILLSYGPMEAMFSRFCSIGYSQRCGLCRKNRAYQLRDEEGRLFPLTPKLYADCSLQIWYGTPVRFVPKTDCIRAFNFVEEGVEEIREKFLL